MKFAGVTACPTGIAHSQMAAENLENTAEAMGHEIHVEIQGAMGQENELPTQTIRDADAVIIAADTSVQRDRFEGKPIVKGTVKSAVSDAESLIEEAVAKAEAAEADAANADAADVESSAQATPAESASGSSTASSPETSAPDRRGESAGLVAKLKDLLS